MDQDSGNTKPGGGDPKDWRAKLGIKREGSGSSSAASSSDGGANGANVARSAPEPGRAPLAGKPIAKPAPMAPRVPPEKPADFGNKVAQQGAAARDLADQRAGVNGQGSRPKFSFAKEEIQAARQEGGRPQQRSGDRPAQRTMLPGGGPAQSGRRPGPQSGGGNPPQSPRQGGQLPPQARPRQQTAFPNLQSRSSGGTERPQQQAGLWRNQAPPPQQQQYPGQYGRQSPPVQPPQPRRQAPPAGYPPQQRGYPPQGMPPPARTGQQGYGGYPPQDPSGNWQQRPAPPPPPPARLPQDTSLRGPIRPGSDPAYDGYAETGQPYDARTGGLDGPGDPVYGRDSGAAPLQGRRPDDYGYDDDLNDVFDDDGTGRRSRRASAADYNAAYQEFDDDFADEDEGKRGAGPLILLLALLVIAAIAGGVIYFYQMTSGGTSGTTRNGNVPVIEAPDKPTKVEPQPAINPSQPAQPTGRKKIYDRILGEETLEPERIVPTEETPRAPAASDNATQPSGDETEPLPLPLPPPPGGQQGAVPGAGSNSTAGNPPRTVEDLIARSANTDSSVQPAGTNDAAAAAVPDPATAEPNSVSAGSPPLPRAKPERVASVETSPDPPAPAPPVTGNNNSGSSGGPVPIAPIPGTQQPQAIAPAPAQPGSPPLPDFLNQAQGAQPTNTQTRRTRLGRAGDDPFGSNRPAAGSQNQPQVAAIQPQQPQTQPVVPQQPAVPQQPVVPQQPAAVPQQPVVPQQPAAPAASGPGYVVQVSAYRSEAEARQAFQSLRSRHGNLIGNLGSQIQQADLGPSGKFYRLGVGPIASKNEASRLCNSLIAAGEADCLVRQR